jgi:chemotaxis protein MotB
MSKLKDELQRSIRQVPNFDKLKDHIDMTVTNEGLRIELLESSRNTFFDSGSPAPNHDGQDMLIALAQQLGQLPNKIAIEGHTDAKPYAQGGNYGNWELSADRANAARRLMQEHGVREDQITQVRGFADQKLRKPDPFDPSNRRISLIVQYLVKPPEDDETPAAPEGNGQEAAAPKEPAPATR